MITLNEFLSTAMLENLPLDFTVKKKVCISYDYLNMSSYLKISVLF